MKKILMIVPAFLIAIAAIAQKTPDADKKKLPPPPPPPPKVTTTKFTPPKIVKDNEKGYAISVAVVKGDSIVSITDDNGTKKIKMKDWKANEKYYVNKYGQLPSPPPPPPPPPAKE